jgi:hypothetical protein
VPDGNHKIVYDDARAYLCSDPLELTSVASRDLARKVRVRVRSRRVSIGEVLEQVFAGFEDRSAVRRSRETEVGEDPDRSIFAIPSDEGRQPQLRRDRLARIRASGRSYEEGIALAVGAESWSSGAQLIFVTESTSE